MPHEEPTTTDRLFNHQALILVVAQILADRFASTTDPVAAHRAFTDRVHARIDLVQPLDPDDFERLNALLLHDGLDRVMNVVDWDLDQPSDPDVR